MYVPKYIASLIEVSCSSYCSIPEIKNALCKLDKVALAITTVCILATVHKCGYATGVQPSLNSFYSKPFYIRGLYTLWYHWSFRRIHSWQLLCTHMYTLAYVVFYLATRKWYTLHTCTHMHGLMPHMFLSMLCAYHMHLHTCHVRVTHMYCLSCGWFVPYVYNYLYWNDTCSNNLILELSVTTVFMTCCDTRYVIFT